MAISLDGNLGVYTSGNVSATGNITGSYILGNGALLTGITASANLSNVAGNIIPASNVTYSLGNSTNQWKDLWISNNTIFINSLPLSTVNANGVATIQFNGAPLVTSSNTAPPQTANIATTADIIGGNLVISNTTPGGGLTFPDGTIQTTAAGSSNYGDSNVAVYLASGVNTDGIDTTGNVTANFFIGDGSQLTGLPASYGNANVEAYLPTSNVIIAINSNVANTNSNVANLTLTVANLATASSLANTDSNVANLTTALGNTNSNVANLVTITTNTDSNVANLTTSLSNTNSNVANLVTITTNTDSNVANLTTSLSNTNSNVANLTLVVANLATSSSLANTDANVANLTTALANTNSNVANLAAQTANNTSNISQINIAIAEGVTNLANTNANVANTNSNVANLQTQVNALPVINTIPSVYLTAVADGNGQTFSNVILGSYTSNTSMTVFLNGVLLENTFYTLAGDVLTIDTYLNNGDNIDVITTLAANVNNVSSGYGNSNVALFFDNYAGNFVPATNNAYQLGTSSNVWANVYANTFVGDGSQLTGMYGNTNVAAYLPTYTGNISTSNIVANTASVNNFAYVPQTWFKGTLSANQNLTTSADTIILWNTNTDPLTWGTTTGSDGHIVPNKAGWYEVISRAEFSAIAGNTSAQVNHQILVNGLQQAIAQSTNNATLGSGVNVVATAMVELNGTTDYITTSCYTTVAGQQMAGTNASMILVKWIST